MWLGPLLLARAASDEQLGYGGKVPEDVDAQYQARGAALAFMCEWVEDALSHSP